MVQCAPALNWSVLRRLKKRLEELPALRVAILGLTAAVIGSYAKALPPFKGDLFAAFQRLFVVSALLVSALAGTVLLMLAALAGHSKSSVERLATLGFVVIGAIFIHALTQLSREQYLISIVPVLAAVLTAWGFSAFRGPRNRRQAFSERMAPRP